MVITDERVTNDQVRRTISSHRRDRAVFGPQSRGLSKNGRVNNSLVGSVDEHGLTGNVELHSERV